MKCIPFSDLFNLVLSCRNDTKEDVFVHQVSACVNVSNSGFKGCEKGMDVFSTIVPYKKVILSNHQTI